MKHDTASFSRPEKDSEHIEGLAADWLARRDLGFSSEEQAEFSRWILDDPRHAGAVEKLDVTWRLMRSPRLTGQAAAVELAVARRVSRRRQRRLGMVFVGVAAAAAFVFIALSNRGLFASRPTTDLARSTAGVQTLEDGSIIELDGEARIQVDFTSERRNVRLVQGRAHFTVAKDKARPFIVQARAVAVRAVGTEFLVNLATDKVAVLVTEGLVTVERETAAKPTLPSAAPIPLAAHAQAILQSDAAAQVQTVSDAEIQAALSWRKLRVEFCDMPLAEAVELFNRRNRVKLAVDSTAIGEIRISGNFRIDDPEGFSRVVRASAGLSVVAETPSRLVFQRE